MPPISEGRFPKGRISTLWDAIVTQLQSDPVLRSQVDNWNLWSGDIADLEPNPQTAYPAIKARPKASPFKWTDEGRLDGLFLVEIEYAVEGTYVGDLLDMWEAIATAMSCYAISAANPPMTWGNYLIGLGVYAPTLSGPGFEPQALDGTLAIATRATLSYSFNLPA
jgi:hypothetical protein